MPQLQFTCNECGMYQGRPRAIDGCFNGNVGVTDEDVGALIPEAFRTEARTRTFKPCGPVGGALHMDEWQPLFDCPGTCPVASEEWSAANRDETATKQGFCFGSIPISAAKSYDEINLTSREVRQFW